MKIQEIKTQEIKTQEIKTISELIQNNSNIGTKEILNKINSHLIKNNKDIANISNIQDFKYINLLDTKIYCNVSLIWDNKQGLYLANETKYCSDYKTSISKLKGIESFFKNDDMLEGLRNNILNDNKWCFCDTYKVYDRYKEISIIDCINLMISRLNVLDRNIKKYKKAINVKIKKNKLQDTILHEDNVVKIEIKQLKLSVIYKFHNYFNPELVAHTEHKLSIINE